jgi:parallel beta-helix repeat protein
VTRRLPIRFARAVALLALALMLLPPSQVAHATGGTTRWVNDDATAWPPTGSSCQRPGYNTIQAAVTASGPGDLIKVCPGTYTEQVTVPPGKNGLSLVSVGLWQAVIKAPAVMLDPKAIVRVIGSQNVTILAFKIAGPGGAGCDSLRWGVLVDGGAFAYILGNYITHIRDNPFSGCQNGIAVLVGRASQSQVGKAKVIGNVIDNYQKGGVVVDGPGSYGLVVANRVVGAGPTAVIAQNGIQFSTNATGTVDHNFIANHLYTPQTVASTGLLTFGSGDVSASKNTVAANDVGGYLISSMSELQASHNRVKASTFDGFALDAVSNAGLHYNNVEQNDGPGIGLYDSPENTIDANNVDRNAGSGILLDNADTNLVRKNQVRNNGSPGDHGPLDNQGTDGIRVEVLSDSNRIERNYLKSNVIHDCHDSPTPVPPVTPPLDNTWTGNLGQTQNRPGLCKPASSYEHSQADNDYQTTAAAAGWSPTFAWQTEFPLALDYDWAAGYSTVNTQSLLDLLPRVGTVLRPRPSPSA